MCSLSTCESFWVQHLVNGCAWPLCFVFLVFFCCFFYLEAAIPIKHNKQMNWHYVRHNEKRARHQWTHESVAARDKFVLTCLWWREAGESWDTASAETEPLVTGWVGWWIKFLQANDLLQWLVHSIFSSCYGILFSLWHLESSVCFV